MEVQTIARACGKSHVRNLEPEDLVALTVEASAIAQYLGSTTPSLKRVSDCTKLVYVTAWYQ